MERRAFLLGITSLFMLVPAKGLEATKVYRLGYLGNGTSTTHGPLLQAFKRRLEELGWIDGHNVSITAVWADGDLSRHRTLVEKLIKSGVDVIVLAGASATRAAQETTTTIPIVSVIMTDPVNLGFARSLARPGGNITGLADQFEELVAKQMQLLKQTIPGIRRVGILFHSVQPVALRTAAERAARALSVDPMLLELTDTTKVEGAFEAAHREHVDAMHVLPSPSFNRHRVRLAELGISHRLPAVYEAREYVDAGGLMSYGPDFSAMYRRAAGYVDRILRGTKPADLPIEQPTKFEFVVNMKTAKALRLTIPRSLLLGADHVIE
jgi:putative tryptophan/tyrosine transport system substrate-binding protein